MTAVSNHTPASALQSSSTAGLTGKRLARLTVSDLEETLRLVLEQLLREQEQRLLEALMPLSSSPLDTNIMTPASRASHDSASMRRERPQEQERTHNGPMRGWRSWRHVSENFGWPAPSSIKIIEDTRDSELLGSTKSIFRQKRDEPQHQSFTGLGPETLDKADSAYPIPIGNVAALPGTMPICQQSPNERNPSSETFSSESDNVPHSDEAQIPSLSKDEPSRLRTFSWGSDHQALRAKTSSWEGTLAASRGRSTPPPMQHPHVAATDAAVSTEWSEPPDATHQPKEGSPGKWGSNIRYLPALAQLPLQPKADHGSAASTGVIACDAATSSHQSVARDINLFENCGEDLDCAAGAATAAAQGVHPPCKSFHSSGRGSSGRSSFTSSSSPRDRRTVTPPAPGTSRILSALNSSSDSQAVRLQREDELLREFRPVTPMSLTPDLTDQISGTSDLVSEATARKLRWLTSPLLLRLCGILPWGCCGEAYRWGMRLLAAGLVIFFAVQFHRVQSHMASPAECPDGICMHYEYLSDLVLATGSFLGLLAMHQLTSLELLGSTTDLLMRYAIEHEAVWKWSCATSRQTIYLAILWLGTLAFRAVPMALDPCPAEVALTCTFAVTILIFMGLVFSILHVSCFICVVIDSYTSSVSETMDLAPCVQEWDKLGALLRTVSRAFDKGFMVVQTTLVTSLLCSFGHLMLQEGQQIWRFASNMVLALSLFLIFSKAAEVTEMCTRVPSLINSLDCGGNDFSPQRHYLVEHIIYSAAGFYVGEVRLTAGMALKLLYVSIVAAFGVLTKLTAA